MGRTKSLILCGGPGTRLRPITYYFQKAMIPIGTRQKPLLEYIIRLLRHHGLREIYMLVNYKAEQIVNYFDDGSRFDVEISYVYDEPGLGGTGGSVLNAYRKGVINLNDTILVYYGDILSNINLKDFLEYHRERGASATVALSTGFTIRVGLATVNEEGRLLGFVEKPKLDKPVSMGILTFNGEALADMEGLAAGREEFDLMRDVIPHLIERGRPVYGYISDAFWYDVGSTEAYEKLNPKLVDEVFRYLFTSA